MLSRGARAYQSKSFQSRKNVLTKSILCITMTSYETSSAKKISVVPLRIFSPAVLTRCRCSRFPSSQPANSAPRHDASMTAYPHSWARFHAFNAHRLRSWSGVTRHVSRVTGTDLVKATVDRGSGKRTGEADGNHLLSTLNYPPI